MKGRRVKGAISDNEETPDHVGALRRPVACRSFAASSKRDGVEAMTRLAPCLHGNRGGSRGAPRPGGMCKGTGPYGNRQVVCHMVNPYGRPRGKRWRKRRRDHQQGRACVSPGGTTPGSELLRVARVAMGNAPGHGVLLWEYRGPVTPAPWGYTLSEGCRMWGCRIWTGGSCHICRYGRPSVRRYGIVHWRGVSGAYSLVAPLATWRKSDNIPPLPCHR